jgi:hypothetical protein
MSAINQTSGLKSLISALIIIEAGRATFSGFFAANVFGVVSAKTKITKVNASDANTIESSPQSLIVRIVAILEAKMLTKLLPSRIVPIR